MKKVLIVSSTNIVGGAEIVLSDYLRCNDKHEFYLYTTSQSEVIENYVGVLPTSHLYTSKMMSGVSIRKKPFQAVYRIWRNLYNIWRIIKEKHIEVLYGNNTIDMFYVLLTRRCFFLEDIKIILHIHDILQRKIFLKFIKRNDRYVDAYIVPSKACKDSFLNCVAQKAKIHVVYNGIDLSVSCVKRDSTMKLRGKYTITPRTKIFCFIGYICRLNRKRPDLFVDIVNKLNESDEQYIGVIVGEIEEERKDFLKTIQNGRFIYMGKVTRKYLMEEIYPVADALVLTSDRDPLPTVILEAMSQKVLILSRNVDGVPEMVIDNVTGVLWDYDASVEEIAQKIMSVMKDKEKMHILKEQAFRRVSTIFSLEKKEETINHLIGTI